ncbi:NAD(+) synthase [Metamycoplasma buccale]|uniref:NAD(+) synthase n=1 Tax=Metamycoplasma buccale TaxID=55602 RepID=UPI00398F6244
MSLSNDFKYKDLTKKENKIYHILITKIKNWIKQKVNSANAKGISLGISGGIDSATLSIIASDIFPNNSHFYYFKINEDKETEKLIIELQNSRNLKINTIDLTKIYKDMVKLLNTNGDLVKSNLKSRLFMTSLYSLSQENNTLVLGTDNFDEFYLGYFTKYGDGGCDLLPFANIKKSDIYVLANLLNVPKKIIDNEPSANLYKNQTDEKELGFSYEEFEKWILDKNLVPNEISKRIINLHKLTEHKRIEIPKGPKLK